MSVQLKYIYETLAFISKNGYETDQIKFLKSTTVFLAELFDIDFVLIDKYSINTPNITETVVLYGNGCFIKNLSYNLENTPCDTIINKKFCSYPDNVKHIFPKDNFLTQNNIESYIGKPLWNSKKEPIGLIAFMDTKPKSLSEEKNIAIVLDIIGLKIEEVLEKILFENQLNLKIEELSSLKEIAEEKEQKLIEAQQIANLGHWELDIVNNKLFWSDEVFRIFEMQPNELEASEELFMKLVHPDDVAKLEKAYFDSIESQKLYEVKYRLLFGSRKIKHILGKGHFIFNNKREPIFSIGTILDITSQTIIEDELIKAKEEAEKNEAIFKNLANLIFEGILISKNGTAIECNKVFLDMFGYRHEEIIGKKTIKMLFPEKYHKKIIDGRKQKNILPYEVEGIKKDGTVFSIEIQARNVEYMNANNGRLISFKDISSRKKEEIESRKRITAIEQSANTIVITDSYGNIEYTNPKFTEVTGFTAVEAFGKNPNILSSGAQPKEYYAQMWDTISSGKIWEGQFKNRAKSGKFFWENVTISPIKNDSGEIVNYLAIKEDITKNKEAEEKLSQAIKETEKSEKKFRELYEKSGDAILIIKNGIFVECNQATLKMLGYKKYEDVLNLQPSEISPKIQPDGINSYEKQEEFLEIALEKGTHRFEWWHKKQNGEIFPVEVLLTAIENEPNNKTIHCVWRDITHRKIAEEQLQKQNEKYKILSEDYLNQNSALKQLSNELSEKNRLLLESKDRFINLFQQNPIPLWEQDFSQVIKLLNEKKAETKDLKTYLDENFNFVEACISNIRILNVNKAALSLFGVKNTEELKIHLKKTNTKRAYEVLKRELVSIGANKKTFSDETELVGKDGSSILALIKSVIIDDYGTSVASVIDITAARKTTDELSQQKQLFEKMFNAIHDSIIITNTNREVVMANPSVKNILGYSPEELIGKTTEIFYADKSKFEKAGDKVFNVNAINPEDDYITYYKTKENVIFPGETFGSKLFSNQGKWIGNIGVIRNIADRLNFISELQKAKEIAEKSENSLNEAQKTANIGSYDLDFSTGFWKSSQALNYIFGIDETYHKNFKGWQDIIHPEDLKMMERYFEKNIKENREEFNKEYRIIRYADKQMRWVHGLGKIELDNRGNLKSMIGTIQDISEKRQILEDLVTAKEKAEESEINLRERVKELSGIFSLHKLIEKNTDPATIYAELVNNIVPKSMQFTDKVYCVIEINNEVYSNNKNFKISDGKNYLSEKIWVNKKQIGELKVAYREDLPFIDIYEPNLIETYARKISVFLDRRDLFGKLLNSKEKAEESDRLKTEFIQNMSHEIRTPMNGILGFSELLDNPDLAVEKRKLFIDIIKNSTHQLLHIIDDIMEISVLETKQIKAEENPVCLNDLLHELYTVFNIKATNKNIALVLENGLTNQESNILTDKNKLNKVLSNLLENALKFTNEGFVEMGYKLKKDSEPAELEIYVKDSGIGIKPEKQKLIFDRFSQAEKELSKNVGGLGLGLSIAKENAELLGGKITVASKLGEGAAFFVSIPFKPVNIIANITIEKVKDSKKSDKHTILIAEDEEVNFMVLEILLEDKLKLPCTIIHAKDGMEAVELVKTNPDIGLVLMDIKMPKMDGHEATKCIKQFRPNLPIIAQTAYSTPEEKEKAFLAGCDDFLSKPISKDALNTVINTYLLENKSNGSALNN